jgi:hypothetical protein
MDKEAKDLIDYDKRKPTGFHNSPLKFYSQTSIIMPNNIKPKDSTIWHMQHKPYQV